MRHIPKALEALYPLAGILPPVNRFFLDAARRKDEALQQTLPRRARREQTTDRHHPLRR